MGGRVESAVYVVRPHWACPRVVFAHSGKLSHHPAGPAGSRLFLFRLDHRDETVPVVCREIRSLQSDLPRACIDYHPLNLDVSHLSLFASRRQIKRDPSPRTRAPTRYNFAGAGNAAGLTPKIVCVSGSASPLGEGERIEVRGLISEDATMSNPSPCPLPWEGRGENSQLLRARIFAS